jgi:hypothetical protein
LLQETKKAAAKLDKSIWVQEDGTAFPTLVPRSRIVSAQ